MKQYLDELSAQVAVLESSLNQTVDLSAGHKSRRLRGLAGKEVLALYMCKCLCV